MAAQLHDVTAPHAYITQGQTLATGNLQISRKHISSSVTHKRTTACRHKFSWVEWGSRMVQPDAGTDAGAARRPWHAGWHRAPASDPEIPADVATPNNKPTNHHRPVTKLATQIDKQYQLHHTCYRAWTCGGA